jgi:hypothetical protein
MVLFPFMADGHEFSITALSGKSQICLHIAYIRDACVHVCLHSCVHTRAHDALDVCTYVHINVHTHTHMYT